MDKKDIQFIVFTKKIFKKAVKVLEEDMPKASETCGFCGWAGTTHQF